MIICLDANVVIYLVERNPLWHQRVVARLAAATAGGDELGISDAARLECLVGPLRSADAATVSDYRTFFADPAIHVLAVTAAVWERAAQIRASLNLQPLDSIHLATAVEHGCGLFLTNDAQLARFTDIAVEVVT
jgi:predicted nucleic acid-binding protein